MRLVIAAVGRIKAGAERELFDRYFGRITAVGRAIGVTGLDLHEVDESRARRPDDRRGEEGRALLAKCADAATLIALDERGRDLASEDFAALLAKNRDEGRNVAFFIGGADGLDPVLLGRMQARLRFGAMTLPHQLVRVLLAEQIYRAATILSGIPIIAAPTIAIADAPLQAQSDRLTIARPPNWTFMPAASRSSHFRTTLVSVAAVAAPLLVASSAGCAEEAASPGLAPSASTDQSDALRRQLRDLRETFDAAEAERRKLEADVDAIRNDRVQLRQALIDATRRLDAAGIKIDDDQARLDTLTGSEEAIRRSLGTRRALLGEILAVLQRMGRAAPPALLVRPDDLLAAVHTSMLLGAVLPEMRAEAEALSEDLRQLVDLRASISAERDRLRDDQKALETERTRLSLLTDARQKAQGEAEDALQAERTRGADLARQTTSLEGLIAKLEAESVAAQRARDEAVTAEETRQRQAALETRDQQARIAASPFKDPARLAPAIAFVDAKGKLPMPVSGSLVRPWGVSDGFGGTEKGLSIGARPGAPVTSPSDGWVVYAGPYRSYGQLIVVNAGTGYHIVLAGMEKTSVAVGQFVLSGEPVGTMGNGAARTAAAIAIGATAPILYVEFRKDGSAIDPSPWWAPPDMQRVRG